jgi:hypothetical protein
VKLPPHGSGQPPAPPSRFVPLPEPATALDPVASRRSPRAGRIESKASQPDTELHGVRRGVTRSRSFWRFAQTYWDRAMALCAKRNNAYSV